MRLLIACGLLIVIMIGFFVMGYAVGVENKTQTIPDCREAVVFVTDMQTTFALPAKLCGSDLYLDISGVSH